jgi:hypothetical protein
MTSEVSAISINVETSNRPLSLRKAERGILRFSIADELGLRERTGNRCYRAIRRRSTVSREVSPHTSLISTHPTLSMSLSLTGDECNGNSAAGCDKMKRRYDTSL